VAANLPVHTDSGEAPHDDYGDAYGIYLAQVVRWTWRPMWHLLFSGAFDRFPNLKSVVERRVRHRPVVTALSETAGGADRVGLRCFLGRPRR